MLFRSKKAALLLLQENFKTTLSSITCGATIEWSSKDRIGISYRIERKKINENEFVAIDTLFSTYDEWGEHRYTFTDSPYFQIADYRVALLLDSSYSFAGKPITINPLTACNTTSTQNILNPAPALKIHPNPAQQQVTVEGIFGTMSRRYSLQLLDASGRVLRHFQQSTNNYSTRHIIDLSGFSPGIYFVRIQSDQQPGVIQKLMVR